MGVILFSGEDERMCGLNIHFQNHNKIDYICKVGSQPFVIMKTKQLNRLDVKVIYAVFCH